MSLQWRESFNSDELAADYDASQYAAGAYWEVLWRIEQQVLLDVLRGLPRPERYLDFACGSGRVLSFVEPHADASVGVDISQAMIDRARLRSPGAELVCADLSTEPEALSGTFDLITAFRFLLNAAPDVRRAILRELSGRLRSDASVLVINCHGSRESYKALTLPLRWARERFNQRAKENVLSDREVRGELARAGLVVDKVYGVGLLPGGPTRWLPPRIRWSIESSVSRTPLWRLGVDKIFVCRRAR